MGLSWFVCKANVKRGEIGGNFYGVILHVKEQLKGWEFVDWDGLFPGIPYEGLGTDG